MAELNNSGQVIGTFAVGNRPHGLKIDWSQNIWVESTPGAGPGAPASCPNGTSGTATALTGAGSALGTFCG